MPRCPWARSLRCQCKTLTSPSSLNSPWIKTYSTSNRCLCNSKCFNNSLNWQPNHNNPKACPNHSTQWCSWTHRGSSTRTPSCKQWLWCKGSFKCFTSQGACSSQYSPPRLWTFRLKKRSQLNHKQTIKLNQTLSSRHQGSWLAEKWANWWKRDCWKPSILKWRDQWTHLNSTSCIIRSSIS